MQRTEIVEGFRALSTEEKLDLLSVLWDEVSVEAEARPLSEPEREFLEDRIRRLAEATRPDRDRKDVRRDLPEGR
jgi:hypothetical protein